MPQLDVLGQEIKNGDFVASASKSSDTMIMGVMKDVSKQTRLRIDKTSNGWRPDLKVHRMYTLSRTLKLSDQMLYEMDPGLFDVMIKVREKLSLPTNKELIQIQEKLKKLLENDLL